MKTAAVSDALSAASTREMLCFAPRAAAQVRALSTTQKNQILAAMAAEISRHSRQILAANELDLSARELGSANRDRLLLNPRRIEAMTEAIEAVRRCADPVGEVLATWTRPNGLKISRVRVPLGVVGIIYESRPNVTVDAAALCLKSGNAVVLRGGREAAFTNEALVRIMQQTPGLPEGSIQMLDSRSRDSVEELIRARGMLDVLVPRGGPGLIKQVVDNAVVPVIETGAGNCHVYVDRLTDLDMADRIVINAKTQRPSVCNAAEKLLIHKSIASSYLPRIATKLLAAGVELVGDDETRRLAVGKQVGIATEEDWHTEYLDMRMAIAVVPSLEGAIKHINRYSTHHSDAIVTTDESRAARFFSGVDSGTVYWNASTRFTDGGEFGFGAEMGISNQKLHCRGPFGLPELTTTQYQVVGTGQIRQ